MYSSVDPRYYTIGFPDSETHAGGSGWTRSPVPMWGNNPLQEGAQRLAGLGAAPTPVFASADRALSQQMVAQLTSGKDAAGRALTTTSAAPIAAAAYRMLMIAEGRAPTEPEATAQFTFANNWMLQHAGQEGVAGAWNSLLAYSSKIYDINAAMKPTIEGAAYAATSMLQQQAYDQGKISQVPELPPTTNMVTAASRSKLWMWVVLGTAGVTLGALGFMVARRS